MLLLGNCPDGSRNTSIDLVAEDAGGCRQHALDASIPALLLDARAGSQIALLLVSIALLVKVS